MLVRRDDAEGQVSDYGIVMPTNVEREEKAFGTVEAVGPAIKDLKRGDRVIFGAFAGETIELDEKGKKVTYKLLEDEFVIAFLR